MNISPSPALLQPPQPERLLSDSLTSYIPPSAFKINPEIKARGFLQTHTFMLLIEKHQSATILRNQSYSEPSYLMAMLHSNSEILKFQFHICKSQFHIHKGKTTLLQLRNSAFKHLNHTTSSQHPKKKCLERLKSMLLPKILYLIFNISSDILC